MLSDEGAGGHVGRSSVDAQCHMDSSLCARCRLDALLLQLMVTEATKSSVVHQCMSADAPSST